MITIYALIADDIWILTTPKSIDVYFWGITTFVLFSFLVELVMSALAIDGYLFGFYFWLDLIATISLISDIGWIWNSLFPTTSIEDFESSGTTSGISSSRIKGAKTGTTIGWVVRVIWLVRLIWVVKLYKHATNAMDKKKDP